MAKKLFLNISHWIQLKYDLPPGKGRARGYFTLGCFDCFGDGGPGFLDGCEAGAAIIAKWGGVRVF